MYNGLKYFLTFSLGAAIGSVITWKLVKTKYEQIAQEEIDSVKEVFSRRNEPIEKNEEPCTESNEVSEVEVSEWKDILADYQTDPEEDQKGGSDTMKYPRPRAIHPDEFGDDEVYEIIYLTYYADKVLTNELNELVEDIENTVGSDFDIHFGEYEDDTVFIKNDRLQHYYEICKDKRSYSDVIEEDLNPYEDE